MAEIKFYFTLTKNLSYIASFWLAGKINAWACSGRCSSPSEKAPHSKQKWPADRHMTDIQMQVQHLSASQNLLLHVVHKEECSFGRKKAELGQNERKKPLITLIICDSRKLWYITHIFGESVVCNFEPERKETWEFPPKLSSLLYEH